MYQFIQNNRMISSIKSFLSGSRKPYKWEWFILGILILFPFFTYWYGDTRSIVYYETHFLGALTEGGGWRSYYDYLNLMTSMGQSGNAPCYDFTMYIILGIWGIPLWLFYTSRGLDVSDYFIARMYGKSIFLVALIISVYLVYKICREVKMSEDKASWAAFIFTSCVFVFTAIGINGQADIIGIVFTLLGVHACLAQKRIRFVVFFMIAITCKTYAAFIFVPLLLLIEKRIIWIGINGISALALKGFYMLVFDQQSASMAIKRGFEMGMLKRLASNDLPLINGNVSVVFVLFFLVCAICYLKTEIKDQEEYNKWVLFVPVISMIAIFISFESSSYWYLHMAPWLSIMIVYNSANYKNNILFECAALLAITLGNFGTRGWAFEIFPLWSNGFLEIFFGSADSMQDPYQLQELCDDLYISQSAGIIHSVFIAFLLIFIWMNLPHKIQQKDNVSIRGYAYLRTFLNTCVIYIPIMLYIYNLIFNTI